MRKLADFVGDASVDLTIKSEAPHYYCGSHIRYIYYFHVIGTFIVDLVGCVLSVMAFLYPHLHRESPIYTQVLQHYERLHAHNYHFWYNTVVFVFMALFLLHMVASIVGIFGTKARNPLLLWPHLVISFLFFGVIIILFVCLVFANFLIDKWVFVLPLIVLFFATSIVVDLIIAVRCYSFVVERQQLMKNYTVNTKQVHFKKSKRTR